MWPQTQAHSFIWCLSTEKRSLPTLQEKPAMGSPLSPSHVDWILRAEGHSRVVFIPHDSHLTRDARTQLLSELQLAVAVFLLEEPLERLLKELVLSASPGSRTASSKCHIWGTRAEADPGDTLLFLKPKCLLASLCIYYGRLSSPSSRKRSY